jgi:hypothetical protein
MKYQDCGFIEKMKRRIKYQPYYTAIATYYFIKNLPYYLLYTNKLLPNNPLVRFLITRFPYSPIFIYQIKVSEWYFKADYTHTFSNDEWEITVGEDD